MNKKHIITIAGKLGSGKSSTAKMVAEILDYKHYSTGDFMRDIAKDKGLSLMELNKIAETDSSIDKDLDDRYVEIGKMENIVIDGRLGFHFIPSSFKVFLETDIETSAERILKDKEINPNRQNEDNSAFETKEEIMKSISKRQEIEKNRYDQLYGVADISDHSFFDLVIDTADISIEEVSQKILEEYNKWLEE